MGLKFDTFNKILNHKTWLVPSVHALMGVSISFFHRDLICSNGGKLPSLWSLKTFASPRYIRRPKPPPFPLTKTQLATNSLTCLFSSIKLPFSICSARSCTTLWRGHVCLWHKVSEKGKKTRKRKKEQKIVANLLMILAAMLTMPVSFLSANNFSFFQYHRQVFSFEVFQAGSNLYTSHRHLGDHHHHVRNACQAAHSKLVPIDPSGAGFLL